MFCGQCGSENREGRRFCTSCGSPLDAPCPNCGAILDPTDAFCGDCGTPNPASAARSTPPTDRITQVPVAERRLVSVLFVDLVGFTNYSEGRDAEDVRLLLSDYFENAEEIVRLYGGVVEKFIGDAVMAVWGTPVAREDDTERAVRAAVELVESVNALGRKLGVDLKARAGIYTGEAAVNLAAKGQGMVAGDMVNTASRLQSAADPGAIVVDRVTFLGARDAVAFDSLGDLALRGKDEPVEAWRVLRVVAGRKGFRPADALEPAFTGRDEEFRLIKDLLHATSRERKPRLASLVGIAGIGKSRLVWELYKYIDGLSETIRWHEGRSPAYGEGVAFWALSEMVRMRAEIAETDDDDQAVAKLDACIADYVHEADERDWLKPFLAHLLGLPGAVEADRAQLFAAWRTFFERVAERETAILVFEDLHWADSGLIDFIEHLMAWARNSPILIVTLGRPELLDRRPTWGAGQRNFVSIHLEPLDDDDMTIVLKSLAGELPAPIRSEIIERAEGVPLYAVEMVRMLIDRGDLVDRDDAFAWVGETEHIDVPDSLHALIASRLDVLDTPDRLLVQDASVLGKTFTVESLEAVTNLSRPELEPRLSDLVRREVLTVDTDPRSPERGQYGFVQSLIREVAYQTLSNENRKDRHLAAAEFFASTNEADLIDVTANHYLEAYKNARAGEEASALAERALAALREAAERAMSLGSWVQAQALLEKAVPLASTDADRGAVLYAAGKAAMAASATEAAIEHLRSAIELLRSAGDNDLLAQAQWRMATAYFNVSRLDDAEETLLAAIDELEDPSTSAGAASLYAELGRIYVFKGDYEKSQTYVDRAMVPAEMHEQVVVIAEALLTRAVASIYQGRTHEADALMRGALDLAEQHGLVAPQLRALINRCANQLVIDPATAVETAQRGLEIARRIGSIDALIYLAGNALEGLLQLGEWQRFRELSAEIEDLPEHVSTFVALPPRVLFDAFRGETEDADRRFAEYASRVTESATVEDQRMVSALRVALAFLRGDLSGAVASADVAQVFDIFTDTFGFIGRAALWSHDVETADHVLDYESRSTVRNPWQRCRTKTLEAGIAAITDRRDEAIRLYREALDEWDALGIHLGRAFCQMDMALLVGGPEAEDAAREAEAFFAEAGNSYLVERLRAASVSVA
ncbi:MAG: AAA family ATPase [Actinobacteria bacterium]|nr:AAA family ATPase [Actinomycetota bacterium]